MPDEILYDRMRNVFIGKIAGRSKFNDTLMGFALHYGFKPEVAPLPMRPGLKARRKGPIALSARDSGGVMGLSV